MTSEAGVFIARAGDDAAPGLRVALKDVLDRAGEVTSAGSRALADSMPAT